MSTSIPAASLNGNHLGQRIAIGNTTGTLRAIEHTHSLYGIVGIGTYLRIDLDNGQPRRRRVAADAVIEIGDPS